MSLLDSGNRASPPLGDIMVCGSSLESAPAVPVALPGLQLNQPSLSFSLSLPPSPFLSLSLYLTLFPPISLSSSLYPPLSFFLSPPLSHAPRTSPNAAFGVP